MKQGFAFRKTLLRLLISSLGLAASCTLLFAQQNAQPDTSRKLSVGLLIDTSAHQKKVIEFERKSFIQSLTSLLVWGQKVLSSGMETKWTLQNWSPLDTGLGSASTRIEFDMESGENRRTLLYDALDAALLKLETANTANSKVLIIVAEGNDVGSVTRYSQIKKRAQSAHVQCFVLLVADHNLIGGRVRHYGFDHYDLASATKGKAYDIERSRKNLDKAVRDVLKRVH